MRRDRTLVLSLRVGRGIGAMMMDSFYKVLVAVHGLSGTVALFTYWVAALAKKGSPVHRTIGKAYLLAMIGIIVTAIPMAVVIAGRGAYGTATFLGYLVVITSNGMWMGWRAIKRKRDQADFRGPAYLIVAVLTLGASVAALMVGLNMSDTLLIGFSMVGFVLSTQMLVRRARPLMIARWWMKEHIGAMMGCGVATHIAFLVIGLQRVVKMLGATMPQQFGMIAWFGPLAVAVIAGVWLNRKYVPKRAPGAAVMGR